LIWIQHFWVSEIWIRNVFICAGFVNYFTKFAWICEWVACCLNIVKSCDCLNWGVFALDFIIAYHTSFTSAFVCFNSAWCISCRGVTLFFISNDIIANNVAFNSLLIWATICFDCTFVNRSISILSVIVWDQNINAKFNACLWFSWKIASINHVRAGFILTYANFSAIGCWFLFTNTRNIFNFHTVRCWNNFLSCYSINVSIFRIIIWYCGCCYWYEFINSGAGSAFLLARDDLSITTNYSFTFIIANISEWIRADFSQWFTIAIFTAFFKGASIISNLAFGVTCVWVWVFCEFL